MMSLSKLFIVVSFYANRSEIAAKYCVNKNTVTMHCNGNCFLMKALKKEGQREKDIQEIFSKSTLLICHSYFPILKKNRPSTIFDQSYSLLTDVPLWKLNLYNRLLRPPTIYTT